MVFYVEGLNHNLFSVGQFCDADLEVAFRKFTCFVRFLQGNDLLTGNRGSDLYTISLHETTSSTPICFMAKASPTQAWLWHRRLSHLNFDYINLLSKKDVVVPSSKGRLNLLHMDLCGPMRVASINGKKYILVIVDDYSRYTWTLFLRSKDETLEVLKDFLKMIQCNLQAQNGVVKKQKYTLVEAARTMLSASKLPLFFWAEAIATACYTQNRSIIIQTHKKTAYHIINDKKPSIRHLRIFGCTCYLTRDGENLDKMKEKGDLCILVGYFTQSKISCLQQENKASFPNDKRHTTVQSQQELDLLFGPLYDEFFNDCTSPVNKSSSPTDNSIQKDTLPSTHIQPTSEPTTPTNVDAEENNDNQAEFTNPFCTPPVQTRRQLATDPEMCMFALTVSTAEPKNIKEAMADSAWIEAMQEELHQFDRTTSRELVDKPFGKNVIEAKVEEGIDFEQFICSRRSAALEAFRSLSAYAAHKSVLNLSDGAWKTTFL
ncbi:retrovirus-related pol polyprotein from transposon TNT 1-94 [Tanacetum coccineum]